MMGLAKRVKARILQASTSEIYGDPEAGLVFFFFRRISIITLQFSYTIQ